MDKTSLSKSSLMSQISSETLQLINKYHNVIMANPTGDVAKKVMKRLTRNCTALKDMASSK